MIQYTIWHVEFTIKQINLQQNEISDKKECLQTSLTPFGHSQIKLAI